ncbi:Mdm33 family-domain-containing protein [Podospora didyma]|uniref:Sensitive to high expression protein 9, mitochondrial n=1 Tax=Podospora didyma TaxID=330526 RepID=A0AAE0NZZ5_9PEZI|nr:Mdm33 family-domain-containing protein [Podospora didyma]
MSPSTALRLAVRPSLRGAAFFAKAWSRKPLSQLSAPPIPSSRKPPTSSSSICFRCRIQARARQFSTINLPPPSPPPPPPKPPSDDESKSTTPTTSKEEEHTTTKATENEPPAVNAEELKRDNDTASSASAVDPTHEPPASPASPELPSHAEDHRSHISARFSTFMDNLQTRVLDASQKINDLTGYSAIEGIKAQNIQLETEHAAAQARLRAARHNYKALTSHRAATQREVTTLLARKDTWSPSDLERFTTLYRLDHELEAQVSGAAVELTEAETEESKLSADLNAGILKRYHEEQIWSDRIRRQSTWGTWGLMGVNILLFLCLQFFAEPWRRRRLMKSIAESEKNVMEDVRRELGEVRIALEASGLREAAARDQENKKNLLLEQETEAAATVSAAGAAAVITEGSSLPAEVPPPVIAAAPILIQPTVEDHTTVPQLPFPRTWKEISPKLEQIKGTVNDLYSERRIDLRMRDVSLIALEFAALGGTLVAAIAFAMLRNS